MIFCFHLNNDGDDDGDEDDGDDDDEHGADCLLSFPPSSSVSISCELGSS